MSQVKRLTQKHPTYQKVQKVFDLMDELGLVFDAHSFGVGRTTIEDKEFPGTIFELRDLEDDGSWPNPVEIPPTMEWKIIRED